MAIKIGNSPESWGIVTPKSSEQTSWSRFLDEVAEAGYEWIEMGPYGYLPTDQRQLRSELASRGLGITACGIMSPLEDPSVWPTLRDEILRFGELLASQGGTYLTLVDGFYSIKDMGGVFGRDKLDGWEWSQLIETTHRAANLVKDRFDLHLLFHPCADTHVEYEEQVVTLIEQTDSDLVSLCFDTGHHAYRGGDPVEFIRKYHQRIPYVHLKSLDGDILKRVDREKIPFDQAVKLGVMCEPSIGSVDYAGIGQVLRDIGYDGFAIVEQDAYRPSLDILKPLAIRTRSYIREVGIG